ncbi:MAG: RimK/LysX family protein [Bdellovibrionales bacterium]|nr:RimK/LysX family protein [Bdellovibrionales bacterium]
MLKYKQLVGWCEWVELPEFGVTLKAKLDTGARTSALHAEDITILRHRKTGLRSVRFSFSPQKNKRTLIVAKAPLLGFRKVKSSVGQTTIRPVISTTLRLGFSELSIEVTLVNRDIMGFRMLLGRTALQKEIVIDPSRKYLLSKARGIRSSKKNKC